ncbi:uncharacterized protein BYT42DRAFT_586133 [Radiomyces spectabilis]|uniref:uncharacterized protein n=1 Tax=Radiomyces spectabilis TaxID=64574 RepID=UPI00221F7B98|nr:uncharacterized protein BYT42DRAFT_586133 [Radiomyces spectabilis]KAI8368316.1 hypothetical protein BYT42DRAFT_586133 [Radiomyces spectabilis]
MATAGFLDMALDDIITEKKSSGRGKTQRGGINKRQTGARSFGRNNSSLPYSGRPARRTVQSQIAPQGSRNTLVVSNLHYNVTEKDLYDLFGQIGPLKRAFLHLAPSGKSSGVADVIFVRSNDADRARTTYNNVELDGRPMRISVGNAVPATVVAPVRERRPMRGSNVNDRRRGMRGGPRQRRENRPKPSEADLDAEMDSYMNTAVSIP